MVKRYERKQSPKAEVKNKNKRATQASEKINAVSQSVLNDPSISIRGRSRKLGIAYTTLQRILKLKLHLNVSNKERKEVSKQNRKGKKDFKLKQKITKHCSGNERIKIQSLVESLRKAAKRKKAKRLKKSAEANAEQKLEKH